MKFIDNLVQKAITKFLSKNQETIITEMCQTIESRIEPTVRSVMAQLFHEKKSLMYRRWGEPPLNDEEKLSNLDAQYMNEMKEFIEIITKNMIHGIISESHVNEEFTKRVVKRINQLQLSANYK